MNNAAILKISIAIYILMALAYYYIAGDYIKQRFVGVALMCVAAPFIAVNMANKIPGRNENDGLKIFLYISSFSALIIYYYQESALIAAAIAIAAVISILIIKNSFLRPSIDDLYLISITIILSLIGFGVLIDAENITYVKRTFRTYDIYISKIWYFVFLIGLISYFLHYSHKINIKNDGYRAYIAPMAILILSLLIFPLNLSTEYYHQHPVVEPAFQVLRSGGVLFESAFSQYGQGPVALSILSDGIFGLQLIESSNAAWQIIGSIMLGLLAYLVVSQDEKPSAGAIALASIVLIACGMAFFGRRQSDYPSLLVYRFALPVLVTFILCTFRRGGMSQVAAGAILGASPFWSIDVAPLLAALLICHYGWLYIESRSSALSLIAGIITISVSAIIVFIGGVILIYITNGNIPRIDINYEIIDGYRSTGAWLLGGVDPLVRGVYLYAAIPVSLYAVYMFWLLALRLSKAAGDAQAWMPPLILHHLMALTALASLGFIGRPVKWVIGTTLIFASFALLSFILAAAKVVRERGSPAEKLAVGIVVTGLVGTCAVAVDLTYGPGGVAKLNNWSPVFRSVVGGQMPRIYAKSTSETQLSEVYGTGAESVLQRYLDQGRVVEIVSDNWRIPGPLRIKYDLPSQLPLSAILSDGMSKTRVKEILESTNKMQIGTVILYSGPVILKKDDKLEANLKMLGYRIVRRLRDEDRICLREKFRDVYVYEVRLPEAACPPVETKIEVPAVGTR